MYLFIAITYLESPVICEINKIKINVCGNSCPGMFCPIEHFCREIWPGTFQSLDISAYGIIWAWKFPAWDILAK